MLIVCNARLQLLNVYKDLLFFDSQDVGIVFLSAVFMCSLDPDADPLCMLLLIDFLMLRSREYQPLLHLYQDWEVKFTALCK